LSVICLLALAAVAPAQELIRIKSARVGLPPGRFVSDRDDNGEAAYLCKNNTWAPIYVQLEVVREVKKPAVLVIEGKDSDDLSFSMVVPLPDFTNVLPGTRIDPVELPYMPYVRPSGRAEDVIVSVRVPASGGDPTYWRTLGEPFKIRNIRSRDVSRFMILSLGSKLPGFDLPGSQNENANNIIGDNRALRGGRIETGAITEINLLPDQWFGYEAADVVVLTTGAVDNNFLNKLFADPNSRPRLDALLEWVRRGGKLIVSVGSNAQLVSQYESLREILPMEVNKTDPATQRKETSLDWFNGGRNQRLGLLQPRQGTFAMANLVPKADMAARSMIPSNDKEDTRPKTVVQSSFGLGRITLVAFDLDRSPFTEFMDKAQFWDALLKESTTVKGSTGPTRAKNTVNYGAYSVGDTEDEMATGIRKHVDTFEGVPVISFGWVAIFIIIYTLLIGPIEYFILKKVFKRLELTWITFPLIVLSVSAAAYVTAYSLKGNDLKINKMDVVDVDPASGRVYGRTWFTLFSPRIENYTITVQPNM
ncbi:MAG: hypothetical protein ACRCZF_00495, partial [Gemmataceae bacterium]